MRMSRFGGRVKYVYLTCQMVLLWLLLLFVMNTVSVRGVQFRYHDHLALETTLRNFTETYPELTSLYSVGKSVQGEEMWVLVVGKHAARPAFLVPNVKYIANMHGNEVVGRELLLHLADHFLTQYGKNLTLTRFLETTRVHLMPTMNPDGFSRSRQGCNGVTGRGNAFGYDLNRNFPDSANQSPPPQQKEVTNVIKWIQATNFLLSANLHGGTLVVNYPFDSVPGDVNLQKYSQSPDDDVFRHLALTFSRSHPKMHKGFNCNDAFKQGIVNGAFWYPITGGMQDFMYRNASGYEVLIEMSCCKYPRESQLKGFWDTNRDPLVNFLFQAHMGVKGLVYGQSQYHSDLFDIVEGAIVQIKGREGIEFRSSAMGEYYKLLLPGNYTLLVSHPDYYPAVEHFTVISEKVTRRDVKLMRASGSSRGQGQGNGRSGNGDTSKGGPVVSRQEDSHNAASKLIFCPEGQQTRLMFQMASVLILSTLINLLILV
ncbi:carboxypeptidase [Plakobranchus ocellatus]|uniref:Carboxypeptidase n=1 Tax=Plakobranchus ocellatus TaxID=259542 RepID=A0AAV3ZLN4_9GAST|nr:carboxypeptidase [Plakobranchus ocellatus]